LYLFLASPIPDRNGGITFLPDSMYTWEGENFDLDPSALGSRISLFYDDPDAGAMLLVDEVLWDEQGWPWVLGASMALNPGLTDPFVDNDSPDSWCTSEASYGTNDLYGTPLLANTDITTANCPGPQ